MVCDGDLGLGDFTGDGVAEAVAVCGGHVNPFRADSRGRFDTLASRLTIPIQDPDFVRVGDLKNDEDPDIMVNRDNYIRFAVVIVKQA